MAGPDRSISDIMAFSIELNAGNDKVRSFGSERHGQHLPDSAIASVPDCYFGVNRGARTTDLPFFQTFSFLRNPNHYENSNKVKSKIDMSPNAF